MENNTCAVPGPVGTEDRVAANQVADQIDALYDPEWTEDTLTQCREARAAWDALSDQAKTVVIGDYADPDYFEKDTGDGSLDDPLNQDGITENELLVASLGTAYNDSRVADIKAIEDALAQAYPDWSVRRAFLSQAVINHIYARDGELIDNMEQALQRASDNGVKHLVILPTLLLRAGEYDDMMESVQEYEDRFETLQVAEPLLGAPGEEEDSVNEDERAVAGVVVAAAVASSAYDSPEAMAADGAALVLVGRGTEGDAGIAYNQMQAALKELGYENVYIGSVEGDPIEFACGNVPDAINEAGYTKAILRPLMVTSGEQAHSEVFGDDDDSWRMYFLITGYFEDNVTAQEEGMGRLPGIREIYAAHVGAGMPED